MGNRAVITTEQRGMGVYLHWNGGRDSVAPLLRYCELRGFRSPEQDPDYGYARIAQVMANFMGGVDGTAVGVTRYSDDEGMDPGDNGVYFVRDWRIVGRYPAWPREQQTHPFQGMLHAIDEAQPASQQLGEVLDAPVVAAADLAVGERVWVPAAFGDESLERRGNYVKCEVLGFGDGVVNGTDVTGKPYVGLCHPDEPAEARGNINNYLRQAEYLSAEL